MKPIIMWAGFTDGNLCMANVDDGWGGYGEGRRIVHPCLFPTRRKAREQFRDVRRVEIRELKK